MSATPVPLPGPSRVLIVHPAPAVRRVLAQVVRGLPGLEVAATVGASAFARRRVEANAPDVVLIGVSPQDPGALDLARWLRAEHPRVRAVLVSDAPVAGVRGDLDAVRLGAAGLVVSPMDAAAQPVLRERIARLLGVAPDPVPQVAIRPRSTVMPAPRELVAVGASTGGPPVIARMLQQLDPDFQVPIAIVQHMPEAHVAHFATMLAEQSGREVRLARDGEAVLPGRVYVAGEGRHLVVARRGGHLRLFQDDGPPEHFCRPAVDPLFRSVAAACGPEAIGVLLTGMGSDGALGAVALRAAGAPVVVQDATTSVVWGMPGAALRAGGADEVAPADRIATVIQRWTR